MTMIQEVIGTAGGGMISTMPIIRLLLGCIYIDTPG